MEVTGDAIAQLVLEVFERLPRKRKPRAESDASGRREWVPLAGIVVERDNSLECVALGTGMKCLPACRIPMANGSVLHDWHAEIVAFRSINRFLLEECRALSLSGIESSDYVRKRRSDEVSPGHPQPFTVREDVKLHMYCSEAPCGDASMELTMAAQDDATPWAIPPPSAATISTTLPSAEASHELPGRAYFSSLGIVRRKPSRADAPSTLSKSCSDKIALKQTTSVLCSITSLLISPEHTYLQSLTLPESQYVPEGCNRCFGAQGRLKGLQIPGNGGYSFRTFNLMTTSKEFSHSRRDANGVSLPGGSITPSNIASSWTPYSEETLIGGVLQGRKQNDPRGASAVSRIRMWELAKEVTKLLDVKVESLSPLENEGKDARDQTYGDLKEIDLLQSRREVKELSKQVLSGWIRNDGDERFTLQT